MMSDALSKLMILMRLIQRLVWLDLLCYYDNPKKIWATGNNVNLLTGRVTFNTNLVGNDIVSVQILPTAFLVRREILNKVGYFDDLFFSHMKILIFV